PWVTLACNKDDFGAILVLDARSGSMVSATTSDTTTGWAHEGLVRWDASGTRLATTPTPLPSQCWRFPGCIFA
ncbi:MAG: hypothetical protein AB1Z98_08480, partial [Nannocystaceae bacterium]